LPELVEGHSLIIANLPYLTPAQYRANPDLWHEPKKALIGGNGGLKYFRRLFQQLSVIARSKRRSNPLGFNKIASPFGLAMTREHG
jgi:methylase of polypeptide subunit release factors